MKQYTSSQFVESAGAILFDFSSSPKKVCLIHYVAKDEWLLAKGRRNIGESHAAAAVREAREETGYECKLRPVTMKTRAPHPNEPGHVHDEAREYPGLTEPFHLTRVELEGGGLKLIYWYIAEAVHDGVGRVKGEGEERFKAEVFECGEAVEKLTYEIDKEILEAAISIVEEV
jgi:8-oxo-dGTP pyrophosphatase MutT (NUDIX family)